MRLYLTRHGDAQAPTQGGQPPLSANGRSEIEHLAKQLQQHKIDPAKILHSTKLRARQTAQIIAETLNMSERLSASEDLAPDDAIDPMLQKIAETQEELMLVSHLPFLPALAAELLGAKKSAYTVDFNTGSTLCLERNPNGHWKILWLITPSRG